jgi:lactate racemase
MVGAALVGRVRVVNHDAHDPTTLAPAGAGEDGHAVSMCRAYVEADRRIVLGLVEPHFMAGFSGGYKGVFPAVADIGAILRYHDAEMIGHPKSTWGVMEGNPTQRRIRHDGALLPVDFCVNVTVNRTRAITGVFCGAVFAAHEAGCAFSRDTAMVEVERPYPIVVTTNSGYPLDQNLYQAVKGMSRRRRSRAPTGSSWPRRDAMTAFRRTATFDRSCSIIPPHARCSTPSPRRASSCSISGRHNCSRSSC